MKYALHVDFNLVFRMMMKALLMNIGEVNG